MTAPVGHVIEYDEINAARSEGIIDEIDAMLAKQYGLIMKEMAFITNCDIKHRMGQDSGGDGDE